ncbi:MAG: ABC transporter ATP-binding protein [Phycisphaerae bacterium]
MKKKQSSTRYLLRYLSYAKPYRWQIVVVILAGIAKFTFPLIPAKITGILIDEVVNNVSELSRSERIDLLWFLGGILAAVAVAEAVAIFVRGYMTSRVSTRIAFDVRHDLWRHIQRLSLNFHHSRPTGSILSRLMSDISVSQQMINTGIVNVCIDAASATVALAFLLSISWRLTLLVLIVLPVYGVLYRLVNPRLRQASRDVQEQTSVMSGSAVERLAGMAVIQSFAQEKAETAHFAEQAYDLRSKAVRRGKLNQILGSGSNFLMALVSGLVLLTGSYLCIEGDLSAGQMVAFTAAAGQLYLPIRRFSQINIMYQTSMAAIERVFRMFDIVPEVTSRPDARQQSPEAGRIEFDRVEFGYDPQLPVLEDLSFEVQPGERIAIVGESGAGKSTLVTLIPRLYDVTGGAIRIDGVDIRDYRLRVLRRSIGIVLQDTILFSGTIRENLRYGRKNATDQEIRDAARMANAEQFILQLPDGYDAMIGERGLSLSGGQRQRISLARTILQNPRILILDEATSALDSESENLITEALERVMVGRTCVIIAHRLSTVIDADRILVFRQGRLVEQGPHEQLLGQGGYYRYLFEQQFGPLKELLDRSRLGG